MVSDPEAVKAVLTAPPEVAPTAAGASPFAPIMGSSSVIVLTGYEHHEAFRPERFLVSGPERFSWIPFGRGIRRCIGVSFALVVWERRGAGG
jgi:cytochrome P450